MDPQLGEYPAASIVAAAERARDPDERTLILADVSRKALWQVERFVGRLLEQYMKPARAAEVARVFSSGTWTHDYPLEPEELEALGLPVKVGVPRGVHEVMRLYRQPRGRQESVEYVTSPPRPRSALRDDPEASAEAPRPSASPSASRRRRPWNREYTAFSDGV